MRVCNWSVLLFSYLELCSFLSHQFESREFFYTDQVLLAPNGLLKLFICFFIHIIMNVKYHEFQRFIGVMNDDFLCL